MKYTLTKLTDDVFNGAHPNGIYAGYTVHSNNKNNLIVGERYFFGSILTSTVTEIILDTEKETIFKTNNSTYKIITNE